MTRWHLEMSVQWKVWAFGVVVDWAGQWPEVFRLSFGLGPLVVEAILRRVTEGQ